MRGICATAVVLTAIVATNVSLGAAKDHPADQRTAVLQVVQHGRAAILKDRPGTVCGTLTRRARGYSLLAFEFESLGRNKPITCVQAVGRMIDAARKDGYLNTLRRDPYRHFKLVSITRRRAHVRLADADIYLVRQRQGWRADHASFSPFDGSSGR